MSKFNFWALNATFASIITLLVFALYDTSLIRTQLTKIAGRVDEVVGRVEEQDEPVESPERRDRFCQQTCKALKYRPLMSATDGDGAICRCGTPTGVLFLRDDGEQRTVLNAEADREDDWQTRRTRTLEASACLCGALSSEDCGQMGLPWAPGRLH